MKLENKETIEISSGKDLKKIEENPNAHFILTDDIEFKDKRGIRESIKPDFMKDYTNYYNSKSIKELNGILDGNGYTIRNFSLSCHNYRSALIRYNHGTIKNLNIENVHISNRHIIGGLVAENTGTIKNCSIQGEIEKAKYNAGGIVGLNKGEIINCDFEGSTSACGESGGICGKNLEGVISECRLVNGQVSGDWYVGGIVGHNISGNIEKSHSSGKISGNSKANVGSIVGINIGNNSFVSLCSSNCEVNSGGKRSGGLIGQNFGTLKDSCFYGYFEDFSPHETCGILTGENLGEIKDCSWNSVNYEVEMKISGES